MRAYPLLNLSDVTPDPELLGQVSHALASYYQALPLAREDGQVSVAMAYPENATAVATLSRLLGGSVVPVRSASDAIRTALQALASPQPEPCIRGQNVRPECSATVEAWTQKLAGLLGVPARVDMSSNSTLGYFEPATPAESCQLVVVDLPLTALLERVLPSATGPVLCVRGPEIRPVSRILVVLRGYSSDEVALEWAVSLAEGAEATLTLLSLAGARKRAWSAAVNEMVAMQGRPRDFLLSFGRRLDVPSLHVYRKVRQGDPVQQVSDEAADCAYDLIVICAEGEGTFVGRALAGLEQGSPCNDCPVLIIKPVV